jgi:hypothetical protein
MIAVFQHFSPSSVHPTREKKKKASSPAAENAPGPVFAPVLEPAPNQKAANPAVVAAPAPAPAPVVAPASVAATTPLLLVVEATSISVDLKVTNEVKVLDKILSLCV